MQFDEMPEEVSNFKTNIKKEQAQSVPCIIEFPKIGDSSLGYISVAEQAVLPFEIKRVYWTYFTPDSVIRGGHAHYELEQLLVAVSGKITVTIKMPGQTEFEFILDSPNYGLYIPKLAWRTMKYSHDAIQLCLASLPYDEKEYIRDYEVFLRL
jgi:hypothetical protein